jgi:hypothetical protein
LEHEQAIRFRDESSGLINTLPREPDKLAYFGSILSSPDRTLSRKIRVTDVGEDVKGRVIGRSLPVTGGSATGLSATDAWGRAAVGDTR